MTAPVLPAVRRSFPMVCPICKGFNGPTALRLIQRQRWHLHITTKKVFVHLRTKVSVSRNHMLSAQVVNYWL